MQVQYLLCFKLRLASFFSSHHSHTICSNKVSPTKDFYYWSIIPLQAVIHHNVVYRVVKGITDTKTEIHVQRVDV